MGREWQQSLRPEPSGRDNYPRYGAIGYNTGFGNSGGYGGGIIGRYGGSMMKPIPVELGLGEMDS